MYSPAPSPRPPHSPVSLGPRQNLSPHDRCLGAAPWSVVVVVVEVVVVEVVEVIAATALRVAATNKLAVAGSAKGTFGAAVECL